MLQHPPGTLEGLFDVPIDGVHVSQMHHRSDFEKIVGRQVRSTHRLLTVSFHGCLEATGIIADVHCAGVVSACRLTVDTYNAGASNLVATGDACVASIQAG